MFADFCFFCSRENLFRYSCVLVFVKKASESKFPHPSWPCRTLRFSYNPNSSACTTEF